MNIVTFNGDARLGNWLFRASVAHSYAKQSNKKFILLEDRHNMFKYFNFFDRCNFISSRDLGFKYDQYAIERCYAHNEDPSKYTPLPLDIEGGVYLRGYYQSYDYIRQDFQDCLRLFLGDDKIKTIPNTCSVYVRRGDYLNLKKYNQISLDYYRNAMEVIGKELSYTIYSDDLQWCKSVFTPKNGFNYKINFWLNISPEVDLRYSATAEFFIITNSTFAWWAPMLTENITNKVIAPKAWWTDQRPFPIYNGLSWNLMEN